MTTNDQAKPMEWWLITWKMGCYDAAISDEKVNDDDIHVIEMSAFTALQEELEAARAENDKLATTTIELRREIAKLKEAYGVLRDAIVYINKKVGHCPFSIDDRWGDVLETSYKTSKRAIARAEEVLK